MGDGETENALAYFTLVLITAVKGFKL